MPLLVVLKGSSLSFELKVTPQVLRSSEKNTICSTQFAVKNTLDFISVLSVAGIADAFSMHTIPPFRAFPAFQFDITKVLSSLMSLVEHKKLSVPCRGCRRNMHGVHFSHQLFLLLWRIFVEGTLRT